MVREVRLSGVDPRGPDFPARRDAFDDDDDAFLSAFDPRSKTAAASRDRRVFKTRKKSPSRGA
ncbi:MAG: hypothetical protein ACKVT0_18370 [Planctomycetaceae bacterium]